MPEQDFVEASQDGEEKAQPWLVDTLLALPGNQGLLAEITGRICRQLIAP